MAALARAQWRWAGAVADIKSELPRALACRLALGLPRAAEPVPRGPANHGLGAVVAQLLSCL
eukprot:4834575-Pyramimonas_sp.AAC.1